MSTQTQNNDTLINDQEKLVDEFFSLNPPMDCKEKLTDKDLETLAEFQKLNRKYLNEKCLYKHTTDGYMYTIDKRPSCGLLEWFAMDGKSIHMSPMNYWAKPTRELIDAEKEWLCCVELIGKTEPLY